MKKLLLVLLSLMVLFVSDLHAQYAYKDIIYLKSGRIIKGIIIEEVPFKSIKILTDSDSVYEFTFDEIEKLQKEIVANKEFKKIQNTFNNTQLEPESMIVEYGGVFATSRIYKNRHRFTILFGQQINKNWFVSMGNTISYLPYHNDLVLGPILDVRYSWYRLAYQDIVPVLAGNAGYTWNALDHFIGVGGIGSFKVGAEKPVGRGFTLQALVGVELHYVKYGSIGQWDTYIYDNMHGFTATIGFKF